MYVKKTIIFSMIVALILLTVGCSSDEANDENIQTIEAVLKTNFTGPDEEFKKIMEKENWVEDLRQYEENLYSDYFANDSFYLSYVSRYGSGLWYEPMQNNYQLKVNNIEFENTHSEEIIYNFTVDVEYQKEGSELSEVETVTGQANLNNEYKVENVVIEVNDLIRAISE
ncbi:hypothetical protein LC087_15865 [Bacillus carboniphilus]|uniref:Lipoprotein n=1 Tax=Bacillus carboniphilus TaxID=86663 RepID=A0ABY9JV94_9BACI|nr:hypothetical protein [Bacillus carboniphilus]WLR42198.1 hypothetical protein LC087_15865 [Bacillus carboniphilus]